MRSKVWLIGGTSDSVAIAKILAGNNIPLVISVTTPSARSLYDRGLQIVTGCMNLARMQSFCQQEKFTAVIDASHPYAVEVSQQAIAITTKLNIAYLRYERSNYQGNNSTIANSLITELDSFETLLAGNYLQEETVLLTIGCKTLPQFQSWQDRATLYARVLPKIESITIAQSAGFKSDRTIAIRPPLTPDLEKALWQQWNISLVITKASGKAGGEDIKRQVALDLNIPLIIIARPQITYPQKTTNLSGILDFVKFRALIL
ncbi:cobalt-precorrin-6A reductase [Waterburya agarophytonicola K14]|uniref:Cobalt-precorrin-6A reductase n=1 Tax=Waterburya agarophytonicola KI4 TaxID=2874699 RepID=A0A964BMZ3_9CYAN|nr:cobalt-precorrin-6A reductase [Waterburya agarophytonicola]MCC0176358.1 cobalt-precorrin-6A reductase [Waterburya agarophytonicola KI4]